MRIKELVGKKFGKWTVIKYAGRIGHGKYQYHHWKCKCECGIEKVVKERNFLCGSSSSCGCNYKRKGKESPAFKGYGELPLNTYSTLKRIAIGWDKWRRKPKEFSVSIQYLWNLFLKQDRKCALSGILIQFGNRKNTEITASVDRIDSSKGYIKGNVQWVHKDVNFMKQDFDQNEFINWCKIISHNNKNE